MDSIKIQMTFADEDVNCARFAANLMARSGTLARKCKECFRDIQEHASTAVSSEDVMRVFESNEAQPSLISGEPACGLFMGGFKAAMNEKFLKDAAVGLVVNVAASLKAFFPRFVPEPLYERLGVRNLVLDWHDSDTQEIRSEDLECALSAITDTLQQGQSVLVHCAQGRSRSGTVVVAYVSRLHGSSIDVALRAVQAKRSMAQPNDNFMRQLEAWQRERRL